MPEDIPESISIFLLEQADADLLRIALEAQPDWLEDAERHRLLSMRSPRRRREFLAGRGLLRYALTHCYGASSEQWRLVAPDQAQPYLVGDGVCETGITVSISHSHCLVACAVASLPRLGVDIENYRRRTRQIDAIAAEVLHPLELSEFNGLSGEHKKEYFYRAWTLKEALAKADGCGLALPFQQIAFANDYQLVHWPIGWGAAGEIWGFSSFDVATDVTLGLAWTTRRHGDIRVSVSLTTLNDIESILLRL